MRTTVAAMAVLSACALSACTAARGTTTVGGGSMAGPTPSAAGMAPAPAAPLVPSTPISTTMEAGALARSLGLGVQDVGNSVLLSAPEMRARFFPGSDRVLVDGRMLPMGEPARREGPAFLIPARGGELVRSSLAEARAHKAAMARLVMPPPPPIVPLKPIVAMAPRAPLPTPVSAPVTRPKTAGGDPAWTPSAAERRWKYIVIHHSDDHEGSCEKYDRVHRDKGWENGCGYHFVIGNGTQTRDGQVETGPRWERQIQGAHAKTADNRYNEEGVGIVLVGDFEKGGRPTGRQYDSLVQLTRWLMARYGISSDRVLRHSDCKSTACPGKNFPWARYLGDVGDASSLTTPP